MLLCGSCHAPSLVVVGMPGMYTYGLEGAGSTVIHREGRAQPLLAARVT
jgi:hypothetical protein